MIRSIIAPLLAWLVVAPSLLSAERDAYFPPPESQGGWRQLAAADEIRRVGMDPAKLAELKEWLLASDNRNFAAVVIKNGHVVLEVERANSSRTDARRVASVSKAVCATVLAIASEESQQGHLPRKMRFDDLAFDFIPWAQPLSDPRKAKITVKQLLNHTSGICPEATGARNDGTWQYVLGHSGDPNTAKLAFEPGTGCGYSTHAFCHAALVCETVTGSPYDQYAIQKLFKPIGCEHWWFQVYEGDEKHGTHPSHGMGMPARDLARIGYCMLRGGKWNDKQVIPAWFVEETAAPTHDVETPELRWKKNPETFSHGWELPARLMGEGTDHGRGIPADARFKPGSGGQLVAFVPSLDLVITRQTGSSGTWEYAEYLRRACQAVIPTSAVMFDADRLQKIAEDEMRTTGTPGAAIAIVRDGNIKSSMGLGLANVETQQPVTPDMLFRLGSTTKMFTAAALVSLAEEGNLRMDDPVGKCVSDLHPRLAVLTPHQLLTHTAGLTDESVMSGRHDDEALAAGIRSMDESWLFTEPGKIHSYANPGYWIAGRACEQIAGKPYADVLDERLFRPLGMTRTTLRPTMAMTWPLALGHEVRGGQPIIVRPQADNAATWPAGQMYSSVVDLARWTTAFMDGGRLDDHQVLSPTLIATLASPFVLRPGEKAHYGYGLAVSTDRGVRILQHGGSRTGYGSTIRMAPDHNVAVIILTNRSGSSLPKTATAALEMMLPLAPKPEPTARRQPLSEKEMAELAGVYTNNRQTIELTIRDGRLLARRRGAIGQGGENSLTWTGENRLGQTTAGDSDSEPSNTGSYFLVRDSAGCPEYLISGSRALKRQSAAERQ